MLISPSGGMGEGCSKVLILTSDIDRERSGCEAPRHTAHGTRKTKLCQRVIMFNMRCISNTCCERVYVSPIQTDVRTYIAGDACRIARMPAGAVCYTTGKNTGVSECASQRGVREREREREQANNGRINTQRPNNNRTQVRKHKKEWEEEARRRSAARPRMESGGSLAA